MQQQNANSETSHSEGEVKYRSSLGTVSAKQLAIAFLVGFIVVVIGNGIK